MSAADTLAAILDDVMSGEGVTLRSDIALTSIAIDVRRIADALDPDNAESFLNKPINVYGETIGNAIQGQIERGQRGISPHG